MICCGCGVQLPDPPPWRGYAYCDQACLDQHAARLLVEKHAALTAVHPKKIARQHTATESKKHWCAWCGEDLPAGKRQFCSADCREDYRIDQEAAA